MIKNIKNELDKIKIKIAVEENLLKKKQLILENMGINSLQKSEIALLLKQKRKKINKLKTKYEELKEDIEIKLEKMER